jgi:hypothetical protein
VSNPEITHPVTVDLDADAVIVNVHLMAWGTVGTFGKQEVQRSGVRVGDGTVTVAVYFTPNDGDPSDPVQADLFNNQSLWRAMLDLTPYAGQSGQLQVVSSPGTVGLPHLSQPIDLVVEGPAITIDTVTPNGILVTLTGSWEAGSAAQCWYESAQSPGMQLGLVAVAPTDGTDTDTTWTCRLAVPPVGGPYTFFVQVVDDTVTPDWGFAYAKHL